MNFNLAKLRRRGRFALAFRIKKDRPNSISVIDNLTPKCQNEFLSVQT